MVYIASVCVYVYYDMLCTHRYCFFACVYDLVDCSQSGHIAGPINTISGFFWKTGLFEMAE